MNAAKINVAIAGASGYTGAELIRLLLPHPHVAISALIAEKSAGQPIGAVFPHLSSCRLPDLRRVDGVDFSAIDLVFCAVPHGKAQSLVAALPEKTRVVDLSADFRLSDTATYEKWYGQPHAAPRLQPMAVYGLPEAHRDLIKKARLVANPGCYPTAAQLPLLPLLKAGIVASDDIVIDAKSGNSGAGRELKTGSLFCEVAEGFQAYGVASHRHTPEIEQGLSEAAGREIIVSFTPHLVPINRGILATTYARLSGKATVADARAALESAYSGERFVELLPPSRLPSTRHVRGTNLCQINVLADRPSGRIILLSAIDNLIKGASGQAVQNMNIMFGFPESAALEQTAMFP